MLKSTINVKTRVDVKPSLLLNSSLLNSLEILEADNLSLFEMFNQILKSYYFDSLCEYKSFTETPMIDIFSDTSNCLKQHLLDQLMTTRDVNKRIGSYIIESLNDSGFFVDCPIESSNICRVDLNTFNDTLEKIQFFDPIGVATTGSLDAIKVQLLEDNQQFSLKLLEKYETEICNQDFEKIAEFEDVDVEIIHDAMSIIRDCNPFPASSFGHTVSNDYITPDFHIVETDSGLKVECGFLCNKFNKYDYSNSLLKNPQLQDYLKTSHLLVEDINRRNKTLLLVANECVKVQKDFLLGRSSIKYLTKNDIADFLGMHASTVSRATSNKYFEWKGEIFPMDSLFNAKKIEITKGNDLELIKNAILNENPSEPYSDLQLSILLEFSGSQIARRTISKYREILKIPNSIERKKRYLNEQ